MVTRLFVPCLFSRSLVSGWCTSLTSYPTSTNLASPDPCITDTGSRHASSSKNESRLRLPRKTLVGCRLHLPPSVPLSGKSWTWPLLPTPSRPMLWCPGPVIHTPSSSDCSKTRIMFPITVDPMTSYALPFGFKQERVSPVFYKATPETKAIPVSVIKRV